MPDPGFGLYVHWPFCQAKCPYCDFNSHVATRIDQSAWASAYTTEIERYAEKTPNRVLRSIFFGGGTPSLMDAHVVEAVIDAARRAWPMVNAPEITLEANPTSVEIDRFRAFRTAGVTRVSVGVQALNDTDLARLGRLHSAVEARRAFDAAATIFDQASFDLIYARQDQTPEAWEQELTEALSLGATHLSLYQLTIEPGTAFGDRLARGKLTGLPEDDIGADMYELTQDLCEKAGLPAYEVSNHARPGEESVHNRIYWNSGEWVGIGPGAHGRLQQGSTRIGTEALRAPQLWLPAVLDGKAPDTATPLTQDEAAAEYLMMGLRLTSGISLRRYAGFGAMLPERKVSDLAELGLIALDGDQLRTTPKGRPLLNAILRDLLV